jgi:tetratricopeptide (TPR) repeat protein
MKLTFEENITTANTLVGDSKYNEAIPYYKNAISGASTIEEKIDLLNVIGRLYLNNGETNKAIEFFEDSLQLHANLDKEKSVKLSPNKAAVLNNLGLLYVNSDPKLAIEKHKAALDIFLEIVKTEEEKYKAHLANTYFSLADAFYKKKDFFFSKKHFKNAIAAYKELSEKDPDTYNALIANCHYFLGNIYNDDNAVYDAKMHFQNSRVMYKELSNANPEVYRPFLAATLNNLGVVTKTMLNFDESSNFYLEALDHYKILAKENNRAFYPYLAATFNSLGILYTEMEERDKALENYNEAIRIYNQLSDEQPEAYTHYLATALHNTAILYDEKSEPDKALDYYGQALNIRRLLANKQPVEFDADVCVTELNLVTLYQSLIEKEVEMKYKAMAEELLLDIEQRIAKYSSDHPTIESMKSDLEYYKVYFKELTLEYIEVLDAMGKIDQFVKQKDSTIKVDEKLVFQQEIMELINNLLKKYPDNERLNDERFAAMVDLSWVVLRTGDLERAKELIASGFKEKDGSPALKINLAHINLLEGNYDAAQGIYFELKDQKGIDNLAYSVSMIKDLEMLKRDGKNVEDIDRISKELKG